MSVISELIFKGEKHRVTSPYGKRAVINTSAGATNPFHYGTDYGTYAKKIPQYAIEDGTILSCGVASDGAKFVWVSYPRIGKKFLHYHLDTISVKSGQAVKKGTKLGTTGMTGKATGIHLHLGVKDLKTNAYEDPEKFAKTYKEPTATPATKPTTPTTNKTVKVGDIVNFTGKKHYVSAGASVGLTCKPGKVKVTAIASGKKHPYHVVKIAGGGSTAYGWVDAANISGATIPTTTIAKIKVGSTVKVKKGAKTYEGKNLASFVYSRKHKVKSINGQRVVITYGGVVVAAVKLSDLTLA